MESLGAMTKTLTLRKARFVRERPAKEPCPGCHVMLTPIGSLCNACSQRRLRGALIDGERCAVPSCALALPRVLRWHRFGEHEVALCANHDALIGRRPLSLEAFLAEAERFASELTPAAPAVMRRSA
jgi:hypothetical protein